MRLALPILSLAAVATAVVAQQDVVIASLHHPGSQAAFESVRATFRAANPGYDVRWCRRVGSLAAEQSSLVLFVQRAPAGGRLRVAGNWSEIAVGDVALLRRGEIAVAEGEVGALVFAVPEDIPDGLPSIIRPDHDPSIADTPGGCAQDEGAYRRVLLTWQPQVGGYVWHAINAHRVRIDDSFSHYHPAAGGFDEFYLVQGAEPGARLLSSPRTAAILDSESLTRDDLPGLLRTTELRAGDLVYVPRGVVHRGIGGVLAQVIAVPGFRPGAEIGVDRELAAIDARFGLSGEPALPYHQKAGPDIDGRGVVIEQRESGARITIDGEMFTELLTDAYHVPILHPVLGPGGTQVTRGYPMAKGPDEAEDHPHHRGVWFAHGDVNGIDFWSDRGPRAGRVEVEALRVPESNLIECDATWRDADGGAVLTERRALRFGRIGAARAIDIEIAIHAAAGEVRFGDTKEGTMAIRLAPWLRLEGPVAEGHIVDSTGRRDGEVWGKRAVWVDYSGRIGDRELGVALLDHPSNPRHPCFWHARGYGLLAANPFGAHDFAGQRRGTGELVVPAGASVTFRYRLLFHLGDAEQAGIMALWRRFAAP